MPLQELIGIWVAAILTFMIFSFLYKDNPVFKLGEHIFLGFAIGYGWCIYYWNDIFPQAIAPLFYPTPESPRTTASVILVLIPIILGSFIVLRVIPNLAWLSRNSFALYVGSFAGIAVPSVISGTFLPQLTATIAPLTGSWWMIIISAVLVITLFGMLAYSSENGRWWHWMLCLLLAIAVCASLYLKWALPTDVNQIVLLTGVFCTVVFFFFSLEHRGIVGRVGRIGILFVMVSFGASFGYTVMARVSLLIGRFQFLLYEWVQKAILGQS